MTSLAQDRSEKYSQYGLLVVGDIEIQHAIPRMREEEFFEFCRQNTDLHIEQDKHGNIYIMSPLSLDSGELENQINTDLTNWSRAAKAWPNLQPLYTFRLTGWRKAYAWRCMDFSSTTRGSHT